MYTNVRHNLTHIHIIQLTYVYYIIYRQSVRFKPPPPLQDSMGWRVEFRTMEVSITDFENAAFTVFVSLLSRAILAYKICLYTPISKVDENMCRAHSRDSVRNMMYYWRDNIYQHDMNTYNEHSMCDILCGTDQHTNTGLIGLVRRYLRDNNMTEDTSRVIEPYLELISLRARGELLTTAQFLRLFIQNHPLYQHDSIITHELNYDIIQLCYGITKGTIYAPELLGSYCPADKRLAYELYVNDKQSVQKLHQKLQLRKTHQHTEYL